MAVPFALAVVSVFNRLTLPEYSAILLLCAKTSDRKMLANNIRTRVVWCSIHGDRAMRDYGKEVFKKRSGDLQRDMMNLFRNIRMALCCSKTYHDLCVTVGFLERFSTLKKMRVVEPHSSSISEEVIHETELAAEGEVILWKHIGGVPPVQSNEQYDLATIKVKACFQKGYNSSFVEKAVLNESDDYSDKKLDEVEDGGDVNAEKEGVRVSGTMACSSNGHLHESPFEASFLQSVPQAQFGVYTYIFGPFHVHVVFSEEDKTRKRSRYRVYIPNLSLIDKTIGGYSVWCDSLVEGRYILNELWMDGKAALYLHNQWYSNVSFFAPAVTGKVPVSHNTDVEVSFKIRKHHTDIGREARMRSGGMQLPEYLKKSGKAFRLEAIRVAGNLASYYRKRRMEAKKTETHIKKVKKENIDKKRPLADIADQEDPSSSQQTLLASIFVRKDSERRGNDVDDEKEIPQTSVPVTQQSQGDTMRIEETWQKAKVKPRKESAKEKKEKFRDLFLETRSATLSGWSLRKIASFFNESCLSGIGRSLDFSSLSRLSTGKGGPSAMVCETIASFIQQELPKRSVDDQRDPTDFSVLPFAEKKLAKLISSPEMHERPPNQLSSYGDAKVTLYDIKRLVRPELRPQMTDTSIYWISDEAINLYTNLLTAIECSPQDCYFFNSLLVELVFKLHHGSEGYESVSQSERESKLQQIADRQNAGRKGQKKDFKTAVKAFAPCNVNNNHWVGLRIDKESYEVVSINSLRTGIADDVH